MARKRYRVKLTPQQVERWIGQYFPDYKRRSKGRQIAINNPFETDTGFHMWISLEQTTTKSHDIPDYYVHDWRNKRHNMTFFSFVRKYRKVSFFEAIREITGKDKKDLRSYLRSSQMNQVDEETPEDDEIEEQIEPPPLSHSFRETVEKCPQDYIKIRKMALNFLSHRVISEERAIENNLYFTPTTIVFPYIEYGELVYWQERDMLDKFFNFPDEQNTGLSKTDYLYNFDNVEQPGGTVALVESIINSINIGEGCMATGGASLSEAGKQIAKLAALDPKMVILAPDYDKAGVESLVDNYLILKKRLTDTVFGFCLPPEVEMDWNDLEKRNGVGTARRYLLSNAVEFDMRKALGLRSGFRG